MHSSGFFRWRFVRCRTSLSGVWSERQCTYTRRDVFEMVRWREIGIVCITRKSSVCHTSLLSLFHAHVWLSYLLNGNILAARTFTKHFISGLPKTTITTPAAVIQIGDNEVTMTTDPLINFSQLAVLTCQRANGGQNKVARESWVRLCGTYSSQGGPLAVAEVRKVCIQGMSFDTGWWSLLPRFWTRLRHCTLQYLRLEHKRPIHLAICYLPSSGVLPQVSQSDMYSSLQVLHRLQALIKITLPNLNKK